MIVRLVGAYHRWKFLKPFNISSSLRPQSYTLSESHHLIKALSWDLVKPLTLPHVPWMTMGIHLI